MKTRHFLLALAFGLCTQLYAQTPAIRSDTVLIRDFKELKVGPKVYAIGPNLSSLTETERQKLYAYVRESNRRDYLTSGRNPLAYNWERGLQGNLVFFRVNNLDSLRRINFNYPMPLTEFVATNRTYKVAAQLAFEFGAGLVRNTIAPTVDASIRFGFRNKMNNNVERRLWLGYTPYYFFEKADKGFTMNANGFAYVAFGENVREGIGTRPETTSFGPSNFKVGVGYLVHRKGDIFTGTTMKLLISSVIHERMTIQPEIIFTNNFKQIFPGLTIRF
ncbi:hypothetical protein GCM10028803_10110 [Larkinella knui]|uniref:Uncharacterized protein n=1 Tax=Larkinella knui TaxID=2025310 RepID=A0A3P1CCK7_9BACT|nr:hypothetical protein [Larkinella knui]RRB11015.1 hypothetical protein EHT87_28150 [Larkinella knui]